MVVILLTVDTIPGHRNSHILEGPVVLFVAYIISAKQSAFNLQESTMR